MFRRRQDTMPSLRRANPAAWMMLAVAPLLAAAAFVLWQLAPSLAPSEGVLAARYVAVGVIAYLAGAVSWGYIFVNLTMGEDIRNFGSGRTGMSNILRTAGGRAAALVFVLDAGKGIFAVLLARHAIGTGETQATEMAEIAAALAALCGHNWPVFLRFRGGRGIMPGVGALSVMAPWLALAGIALFLAVTLSSRYLSLGSIAATVTVAALSLALTLAGAHHRLYAVYALVGGAIIIWQHRDNIRRIANGTERRLGMPGVRNRSA